jgi:hypothetical protein
MMPLDPRCMDAVYQRSFGSCYRHVSSVAYSTYVDKDGAMMVGASLLPGGGAPCIFGPRGS